MRFEEVSMKNEDGTILKLLRGTAGHERSTRSELDGFQV